MRGGLNDSVAALRSNKPRADHWISHRILRHLNVIGFSFAILLLLVIGAATYRNTQVMIRNAQWVAHTQEVLSQLLDVLSAVYDIEAGSRGYALTGDVNFLDPVYISMESIIQYEKRLRNLTADNPSQQVRLSILEPLVVQRMAAARNTINSRDQGGLTAAVASVAMGWGRGLTASISKTIHAMTQEEQSLLARTPEKREGEHR